LKVIVIEYETTSQVALIAMLEDTVIEDIEAPENMGSCTVTVSPDRISLLYTNFKRIEVVVFARLSAESVPKYSDEYVKTPTAGVSKTGWPTLGPSVAVDPISSEVWLWLNPSCGREIPFLDIRCKMHTCFDAMFLATVSMIFGCKSAKVNEPLKLAEESPVIFIDFNSAPLNPGRSKKMTSPFNSSKEGQKNTLTPTEIFCFGAMLGKKSKPEERNAPIGETL
jgi:hypothetical protein